MAAEFGEPQFTVRLEALGRDVVLTKGYTIDSSYLTPTDGFSFTLYDTDRSKLRGLEMQPVNLLIDGHSQCLGRIDMTERGNDGTSITCKGRDYIADMTECHVDPTLRITKTMTLETAILMGAGVVGISGVITDDDFSMREIRTGRKIKTKGKQPKRHRKPLDEYIPRPGESIFAFYNRIVARMGGTIQPGNDRSTVIVTSPRYDQDPTYGITRLIDPAPGATNVVINGQATRDFSSFPSFLIVAGKAVTVGETKTTITSSWVWGPFASPEKSRATVPFMAPFRVDTNSEEVLRTKQIDRKKATIDIARTMNEELASILGGAVATGRRLPTDPPSAPGLLYRLLYQKDAESGDQDQIDRVAVRAFAQKFKETLVYTVTLRGHVDPVSGAIWAVDTLVRVTDEVCDINEVMWIASRTFSFQDGTGATTKLECWRLGAFQTDTDQDEV